jgi:hypothetical protein
VLLYEMLAGRSPFDIAGASENPDQNTEDYLFQGKRLHCSVPFISYMRCLVPQIPLPSFGHTLSQFIIPQLVY